MQFSHSLVSLALFFLSLGTTGMATPFTEPGASDASGDNIVVVSEVDEPARYLASHEKMKHGSVNTDAELAVIDKPIDPLASRSANALTTTVHYCSTRVGGVCGGPCTVYTGGGTCLNAPDTNCLNATNNVAFCDRAGCSGNCRQLSTCATPMDSGFCFTPDTESILVFFAK